VDFRDLNKVCPKNDFSLPITEIIIDHTSSYEIFSFMDDYTGVRLFFVHSAPLNDRGDGMRKKDTEIPPERAFI
jgi:hypothetical protein